MACAFNSSATQRNSSRLPENAFVAALPGLPTQVKLTTAALETLAVVAIAADHPSQIEFIRGVNSDRALASLQHGP